ncbi:MAG TPA: tRNA preQ1(34) S-adenosylmethionine ribosyltransferase-isomerase QueA [Tepidisphaeraceae bacterium]|nr:tRNA preQ1(34) S-adenosylmethionine ribosyltransferase-isomerase QueA [Tepidisphaeraceae bacterium]
MKTDDLDFHLPPELIAQAPASERSASRLLHYRRSNRAVVHRTFAELPDLLRAGDLLVFNDARVTPARFTLRKQTGGRVEGLFLKQAAPRTWHVMLRNLGPVAQSRDLRFADAPDVHAQVVEQFPDGEYRMEVDSDEPALQLLARVGRMPLPPYIKREKDHDARDDFDRERYQTVFAKAEGSVAAPTAGLHFTEELLAKLDACGVGRTFVTLHVGLGTFKPVTAGALKDHRMHVESYSIDAAAADALNSAKREGRRIIPVGTTSARVLESQPKDQPFKATFGETGIFIYPPYEWKHAGALITNFHLPRSTLIALVAAMVGLDEQRRLYQIAIEQKYRFFSYGDAMFIE